MASSRRIAGAFPIGDTGEMVIMEWHPDPLVLEQEIMTMAQDFDDWIIPMEEAREIAIEDTRKHFADEREPIGAKWIPLDEDYLKDKTKEGFPDHILIRTGELERAATSEEAWFVTERALWFNEGALPPYGPIHQHGSGKGVTTYHRIMRNLTVTATEGVQLFGKPLTPAQEKFIAGRETPEGKGRNLPARPFIGLSIQAIEALEANFVRHMDRTITDVWDEPTIIGGGELKMGTNILGTFPIVGYTKFGVPMLRTHKGIRFGKK